MLPFPTLLFMPSLDLCALVHLDYYFVPEGRIWGLLRSPCGLPSHSSFTARREKAAVGPSEGDDGIAAAAGGGGLRRDW